MLEYDIIILTDARYVDHTKTDLYSQNIYLEDSILKDAIQQIGLKVGRKAWDDPHFDWSSTRCIIFRTTWDYFDRFDEFSVWLNSVSKRTSLLNSENIIRWNIDKHYLSDLQKKGVHICKTYYVEKGESSSLQSLSNKYSLDTFIIKPCISGAARHTYKITQENINEYESIFAKLIANEAIMLQPFQYNIVSQGEISMMVMNGKFTHAILKKAKKGDFRVQDDYGGTIHDYHPSQEEINYAEETVKSCPEIPIYARVDVFLDNHNKLALAELELIEPELWFRKHPKAADVLAKAIKEYLKS